MNDPNSPSLHGWTQPQGFGGGNIPQGFGGGIPPQGFGGGMFPGLGDPFAGPPALVNPTVLPGQGAGKPGFLSNLGEWKQMIDRMGGIDGIMGTMGKVQKFVVTMQQMAPLLRVFMGKAGATATAAGTDRIKSGSRRRTNRRKSGKAPVRSRGNSRR